MPQIELVINPSYEPHMYDYSHRFNLYYGGAGSGKSVFVVQKLVVKMLAYEKRKCLVVRKVQSTIKESIFALIKEQLAEMGILKYCKVTATSMKIVLPNGSEFIFTGLDDPEKIKSIASIDDIIIEECTDLTQDDFSQLNLRLRSRAEFQQIHMMFNPVSKTNWVYDQFFGAKESPNTLILKTTFKDNKFLPEEYIESLKAYEYSNPLYYQIYCLGNWGVLGKKVYENWKVESFDYHKVIQGNDSIVAKFGMDFGYVNDASTFVATLVDMENKKLYIFDEMYMKGLTNDKIYEQIDEMGYKKELIMADSAEQKSIEELRQLGLSRIKAVKKGNGSINQGIQFLRQFEMIVHPSCKWTIEELDSYVYKKDKATGLYLNQPVDKNNHIMDALRYAVRDLNGSRVQTISKKLFGL